MPSRSLDAAVRGAGGRIIAALAVRFRNLDLAEEAFAEASLRAARHWPERGVPTDPAAWLYRVAERCLLDALRKRRPETADAPDLADPAPNAEEMLTDDRMLIPDERLRLIFICCHPAVAVEARAALTLKLVCGLATASIARAFLVSEPTLAQRLVRAKRKIAEAGVPSNCRLPISGRNGSMPCSPRWKSPIRRRMRTQPVPARMLVSPRRCWN